MEQKFIKFLCKNGAYRQFMCNLAYVDHQDYTWNDYKTDFPAEDWIAEAFVWDLSPEEHEFWGNLNLEWGKEL